MLICKPAVTAVKHFARNDGVWLIKGNFRVSVTIGWLARVPGFSLRTGADWLPRRPMQNVSAREDSKCAN